MREYWPHVYTLLYRLCSNTHDAEELTQDTFIKALKKIDQFQPGTSLRGWLLRIATNHFLDLKRKRRPVTLEYAPADLPAANMDAASTMAQHELGEQLKTELAKLNPVQRSVFLLRATEDFSFREIAQMIGTTEGTARWHMLQARQLLMQRLQGKL